MARRGDGKAIPARPVPQLHRLAASSSRRVARSRTLSITPRKFGPAASQRVWYRTTMGMCDYFKRSDVGLRGMIVVSEYKGHRIDVNAVAADGRWNADVRSRRTFSEEKPHVETVTCFKLTAELAERSGELWARRWVDLKTDRSAHGRSREGGA
jgi:hypothetical protein